MLTLYDISPPPIYQGQPISPSGWRVRYNLNIKSIPYKTQWVPFGDVETFAKAHKIPPTTTIIDPLTNEVKPKYTLPAMYDDETDIIVSDSLRIAVYLEETYPNRTYKILRSLPGREDLEAVLDDAAAFWDKVKPIEGVMKRGRIFDSGSRADWTEEASRDWDDLSEALAAVEQNIKDLQAQLETDNPAQSPWILADSEYSNIFDLYLPGYLRYARLRWGTESELWKEVMLRDGGRWERVMNALEVYSTIY